MVHRIQGAKISDCFILWDNPLLWESAARLRPMTKRNRPAILRFAVLSRAEQHLFLQAVCLLPIMACLPRIFGLQKVQSWVERSNSRFGKSKPETKAGANTIASMVLSAARYGFVRGNCLSRSMTLCYLLKRHGCTACLRLGGRRVGESFEAHAWVEFDGRVFDESPDLRRSFTPFPVYFKNEFTVPK